VIKFNHVSKIYGEQKALDSVSFELKQGDMAFLTGHSGAGKSTLLKLIMLIERASEGEIWINDVPLNKLSNRQVPLLRRNIGFVHQSHHLLMNKTVFENVAMPLRVVNTHPHRIQSRVQAAVEKVGLLHKINQLPARLSGGEQQRVGIARAVVNRPSLIIADEPTGNLDPKLSDEIFKLFESFNQVGVTVLIATHDLSLIAKMPYPAITLREGQLISANSNTTNKSATEEQTAQAETALD